MELSDVAGLLPGGLHGVSRDQEERIRAEMPVRTWFFREDSGTSALFYCERCEQWHEVHRRRDMPRHKTEWTCTNCGRSSTAYSLRRSHTDMYDDLVVTLFDLGSDGQTLIARTFYAVRDYSAPAWDCDTAVALMPCLASATSPRESSRFQRGAAGACTDVQWLRCVECDGEWSPREVETQLMLYGVAAMNYEKKLALRWQAETIFTYKTEAAKRNWTPQLLGCYCGSGPEGRMIKRKKFTSNTWAIFSKARTCFGAFANHAVDVTFFPDELADAIEGTRLGTVYALIAEDLENTNLYVSDYYGGHSAVSPDLVSELGAMCKCHTIEYLMKLDMPTIALRKVCGVLGNDYMFNWRGKTAAQVLRIPQSDIRAARTAGIEITPEYLSIRAAMEAAGMHAKPEDIQTAERSGMKANRIRDLLGWFHGGRRARALRYCLKSEQTGRAHWRDVLDYWDECEELGDDLNDDGVAFPKNLMELHQRNRDRITISRNREADERIAERLKKLEKHFGFEFDGLILRPAANALEVVKEGETLKHCVARYVESYASGNTVICVLRRTEAPDEPWRTVEIDPKSGRMVQDRGYRNDLGGMNTELREKLDGFWTAFEKRNNWKMKEAV